tara:strand:+ start:36 stop:371 length:336 start_codon:yes stop_codon:yes gene_type:complete
MNYEEEKNDMVPVDGDKTEHKDEDTKMVMRQLKHLEKNACALLEHFEHCAEPHLSEGWVKKKIILANDYIDSVHDYVMSSHGKKMDKGHDYGDKKEMGGDFLVMVERRMAE